MPLVARQCLMCKSKGPGAQNRRWTGRSGGVKKSGGRIINPHWPVSTWDNDCCYTLSIINLHLLISEFTLTTQNHPETCVVAVLCDQTQFCAVIWMFTQVIISPSPHLLFYCPDMRVSFLLSYLFFFFKGMVRFSFTSVGLIKYFAFYFIVVNIWFMVLFARSLRLSFTVSSTVPSPPMFYSSPLC